MTRRKYANAVAEYDGVELVETKMVNGENNSDYSFKGDVWYNMFKKISKKALLPSGSPYLDSGYTWLEFYEYGTKNRLTAMYNANNEIIEWYYDVSKEIGKDEKNGIPYEDDLYLDVIFMPDGSHIILDRDELDEALRAGKITKEEYDIAINEANRIVNETDVIKLKKFTDYWMNR